MGRGPRGLRGRRRRRARSDASARMLALPSCEVLEVERDGAELLVPLVRDAIRAVDVAARRVDVDLAASWAMRRSTSSRSSRSGSTGSAPSATSPTRWPTATSSRTLDPRDHTPLSGGQVDDTPFGGGAGMVLRVDVMDAALRAFYGADPVELRSERRVIALTPGGRMLDDALVDELAAEAAITLLCGRYEGFDERIVQHFCTDAVSIGRYVLAGGELAAMVVCDAVLRKLPGRARARRFGGGGVLQRRRSAGGPEYPHYTRPGRLPRLDGAGGAAVRPPRGDPQVAPARRASAAPRTGGPLPLGRPRSRPVPVMTAAADALLRHEHRHRHPRARPAAPRPALRSRVTACGSTSRSSRARAAAPRSSRASSSSARATACARPSPSASSRSASASSARSPCTRRRSSRSRSPPAATSGAPSSTTCATASASAPACASAATSAAEEVVEAGLLHDTVAAEAEAAARRDAGGARARRGDARGAAEVDAAAERRDAAEAAADEPRRRGAERRRAAADG